MYDFWFTLGAATVDPALLNAVSDAGPAFDFVDRRVIEVKGDQIDVRRGPSTGLLQREPTTKVRLAISTFLRTTWAAAPPVGIYTAGRFCQLMIIPEFQTGDPKSSFKDIIDAAHMAYVTAVGTGSPSTLATFPALLGLCLIDGQVSGALQNWTSLSSTAQAELTEILAEFGVTVGDSNWQLLKAFVTDNPKFDSAANYLMEGDRNPWDEAGGTQEQILFWPDDGTEKGEHAIP